ncbi:MAG TPA: hypothetical protein GX707_17915 [Epulopiscium sp.]|nr:hypothetical protein [Candidatus Epulonipiscium sp.]
MSGKGLLTILVYIVILSGCSNKTKNMDIEVSTNIPVVSKIPDDYQKENIPQEENILVSVPNLNPEKGIREYLVGEWIYDNEYGSDVACTMLIDEDLSVNLSFHNTYTNEPKGQFNGEIKLDRAHVNPNEAPDLLYVNLIDTDDSGGVFLFKHRTSYAGKYVMSWFFIGSENCVFNILGAQGYEYAGPEYVPNDIMFEKVNGEITQLSPRKNNEFYAVFWGKGVQDGSLWLDDVEWTPPEEDEFSSVYPYEMTLYENDVPESVLYNIAPEEIRDILGDDLFPGQVYFVETNEHGKIKHFISAERKKFLEECNE